MLRLCVLTLLAAVLWAGDAAAAQVQLRSVPCPEAHCSGSDLGFEVTDLDGVADDLSVRSDGVALIVSGTPAPSPGPGCTAPAEGQVRCVVPAGVPLLYRQVTLGAGDDRLRLVGVGPVVARGGAGDDVLDADADSEVSWTGGAGADRSTGARVSVSYADHVDPVSVTYDGEPNDGSAGEGDDVGSVGAGATGGPAGDLLVADADGSILDGGDGSDALFGGPGSDQLYGGPGDDVLRGAGGDDTLNGYDGTDDLDGGDGNDQLQVFTSAGQPDRLTGGAGTDGAFIGLFGSPFTLDLGAPPTSGPAGQTDAVSGVEALSVAAGGTVGRVLGGPADETLSLVGRDGSLLSGGGGDDTLTASTGAITVEGGPGRDHVVARDPGNVLLLRDGEADTASCPFGLRTAPSVDRHDVLDGCGAPMVPFLSKVRLRGRRLTAPVLCPAVTGQSCRGTVRMRLTRRRRSPALTGTATLRLRSGRAGVAVLPLSALSAQRLRADLGAHRAVQLDVTTSRRLVRQHSPVITRRSTVGDPAWLGRS